jgi:hypothetical protein
MPRVPMKQLQDLIPVHWRPSSTHYAAKDYADLPTVIVSLDAIEPPLRDPGVQEFDLTRLRRIAGWIVEAIPIQPIEIGTPAKDPSYQYRVRNGFHRFYLCQALGLTQIPTVLIDE